jgi:hypothetical protein
VPRANPKFPPYLVLLRVGFALPAALLQRRCALTAPFHPYHAAVAASRPQARSKQEAATTARRYVFCGTFRRMSGSQPSRQARRMRHPKLSRTLSGTLLCGVRTFLPRHRSGGSDRPVQLPTPSLYARRKGESGVQSSGNLLRMRCVTVMEMAVSAAREWRGSPGCPLGLA